MSRLLGIADPQAAELRLEPYTAELQFTRLVRGTDNVHYDVFLSPRFVEFARRYLLDLVRQASNVQRFYGKDGKSFKPPETVNFRKQVTDLLLSSLTRAQYEKNLELDLLLRVALLKFLTQEIGQLFSHLVLECKEWMRARGRFFENSQEAHVKKAILAEIQGQRKTVFRIVGQTVHQILAEIEDATLRKNRRALLGDDYAEVYDILKNRLIFIEGGRDDYLFLEHYVLLGNYVNDPDRFETFDEILIDLVRDRVLTGDEGEELRQAREREAGCAARAEAQRADLARLEDECESLRRKLDRGGDLMGRLLSRSDPEALRAELAEADRRHQAAAKRLEELAGELEEARQRAGYLTEQLQARVGAYLDQPGNASRLFGPMGEGAGNAAASPVQERLLAEWIRRLEQRDILIHVLASYELRNVHLDFCPPLHLQQLRKALVSPEEFRRAVEICRQFPTRRFPFEKVEELARSIRRYPADRVRALVIRFAEDLLRLRRDLRNAQRLTALMESINLVSDERTRELSRLNNSLYEFVLPEEQKPSEDRITSHAILKVDVRESTRITHELLTRGLNPASHFSLTLYEPVRRLLDAYGAKKVFIEGDAIIVALYETEANRAHQRAVAKACLLARDILAVARTNNARSEQSNLPTLPIGLGIAFQDSSPTIWQEGDSQIMISRALNLSDRLSSCSKAARRLLLRNPSPFNVFLFQTVAGEVKDEEADEFLIRYNMNGIELNAEGFTKLSNEAALTAREHEFEMPWGRERVTLYFADIPMGDSLERIVVRKGIVRKLISGNEIGPAGTRCYYEICTDPKLLALGGPVPGTAAPRA